MTQTSATRKFAVPLSAVDCRVYLEQVFTPLWRVWPSATMYSQALDIQEQSGYGFYDSLIVAGAIAGGCRIVYTQDLQNGRRFDSLQVVDPFAD